MTIYTDVLATVNGLTNRPDLTTETDIAIRQAVNAAHGKSTFFKDLVVTDVTGLSTTTNPQTVDLSAAPFDTVPIRGQLITVKPKDVEGEYTKANILELTDSDNFDRYNIWWQVGTTLKIRAISPVSSITVSYFRRWTVNPIASLDSWIAQDYPDLIGATAALIVLGTTGEKEIIDRIERLAAVEVVRLLADNLVAG